MTSKRINNGKYTVFFDHADAVAVATTICKDDPDVWTYRVTSHGVAYVIMVHDEKGEYVGTI